MKSILKKSTVWIFSSLCLISFSCSKFLEEQSQDEIKPKFARDLRELLNGAAYPHTMQMDAYVDLLTDDIQSNGLAVTNGNVIAAYQNPYDNGLPIFEWDVRMFDGEYPFPKPSNSWAAYYEKIKGCNVILDHLDKVEGTINEKATLRGEALFLRAFYYFKLVNLYAQPYTKAGVDKSSLPGVPLILSSMVSDKLPIRATIAEVYAQIESDLQEAGSLLEAYPDENSVFRANKVTVWALLSRVHLYKGTDADWDQVMTHANKVLEQRGSLSQLSNQVNAAGNAVNLGIYDTNNSLEVLWVCGGKTNTNSYFSFASANGRPPFTVSDGLIRLYEQGDSKGWKDLRTRMYFSFAIQSFYYNAKTPTNVEYGASGIRVAEIYLNRAEAAIRLYIKGGQSQYRDQAINDLNYLLASRYDKRSAVPKPSLLKTGAELLDFCLTERRKELCLENGSRWNDIRRLGIALTHASTKVDGSVQTFNLPADAAIHALPIPFDALLANSSLGQNPRD